MEDIECAKVIRSEGPLDLAVRIPVRSFETGDRTIDISVAPTEGTVFMILEVFRTAEPAGPRTAAFFDPAQAAALRDALLAAEGGEASEALVRLISRVTRDDN